MIPQEFNKYVNDSRINNETMDNDCCLIELGTELWYLCNSLSYINKFIEQDAQSTKL
jgi:hypothetical protein